MARAGRAWGRAAAAVAGRPALWPAAVHQAVRLTPTGWWRRAPFLPVPDRSYLRFRALTQYGEAGHAPDPDDVVQYLRWCQALRRAA